MTKKPLDKAIEIVGSARALAGLLNVTPQAISQWDTVPAIRVIPIEVATKGVVTRHDLRPDVFGPAQ